MKVKVSSLLIYADDDVGHQVFLAYTNAQVTMLTRHMSSFERQFIYSQLIILRILFVPISMGWFVTLNALVCSLYQFHAIILSRQGIARSKVHKGLNIIS